MYIPLRYEYMYTYNPHVYEGEVAKNRYIHAILHGCSIIKWNIRGAMCNTSLKEIPLYTVCGYLVEA